MQWNDNGFHISQNKYNENRVKNEFNHEENKFCRIQPITPTSIKGGGEGGIDFSLTYA